MGFYNNMEEGINKLTDQVDSLKDSTKGLLDAENKRWELTPEGRKAMNADEYAMGKISLDEFIRREKEAEFSISKDDFDKLSLAEQSKLFEEHPDKIRKLLGK